MADLHLDPRHVWVGAAANDPVTMLPGHGPHPDEASFGDNVFTVDTRGHDNYWQPHSESLDNQCRIAMGLYSLVTLDTGAVPR